MFKGSYDHSVDDKGRFIMPSKFREQLEGTCCVTRGMDGGCLYIFKPDEWDSFAARLRELSGSKKNVRILRRHFFEHAENVDIDKQGRCLLSSKLREYAGISEGIRLVGMDNKIELWSMENWKKFQEKETYDIEAIAEDMDFEM